MVMPHSDVVEAIKTLKNKKGHIDEIPTEIIKKTGNYLPTPFLYYEISQYRLASSLTYLNKLKSSQYIKLEAKMMYQIIDQFPFYLYFLKFLKPL